MNSPAIRREQRQGQTLTPRLQQAVRLLQLSSLEFAQELRQAMSSNPFLEADEADTETDSADQLLETAAHDDQLSDTEFNTGTDGAADRVSEVPSNSADTGWEGEPWSHTGNGQLRNHNGSADDTSIGDLIPASVSLRDHLHGQVGLMSLSDRDRILARSVIEALDDDGYLRIELEELLPLTGLDPQLEEMMVALRVVQSLEPAGVAARDLRECLLLQLDESGAVPATPRLHEIARNIVCSHLQQLAAREFNAIAHALGVSSDECRRASELIRHLDPRPGWRFGTSDVRFVTPDVIVRKVRGAWAVSLNPGAVPRVRVNGLYADLFRAHRNSSHGDLAAQLQEARWTVRNVEQRFATILRVAEAIVERQKQFFEFGELAMKPMGLKDIADQLGLHESTVSRVTNGKYMATRNGVFELKYFFSRPLPTASGGAASATAIRGVIKDMIVSETAGAPLSDAQIARLLARQGLQVARRTVTKYRQMIKMPAFEMRRTESSTSTRRSNSGAGARSAAASSSPPAG